MTLTKMSTPDLPQPNRATPALRPVHPRVRRLVVLSLIIGLWYGLLLVYDCPSRP